MGYVNIIKLNLMNALEKRKNVLYFISQLLCDVYDTISIIQQ